MSCNCNTANPNCEPCMICTPPGVTDLPQCTPVDPCEGQQVNGSCVKYNGIDFSCLGVTTGDDIFQVMFAILEYYTDPSSSECCDIGEGVVEYAPPLTTTSTTTTSTTSTTTTTTAPPECSYYEVTNTSDIGPSNIEYVPCNSEEYIELQINTSIFICVNNAYSINVISGTVNSQNWGPCNTVGPTTTTTTTTVPCQCGIYTVQNLSNTGTTITYTACEEGNRIFITLPAPGKKTFEVCACSNILGNATASLLITGPSESCTTTPTTTTTTSTTSTTTTTTSTTTTTTTVAPTCRCYTIENPTEIFLSYKWRNCDTGAVTNSIVAPGTTAYKCSSNEISASAGLIVDDLGLCSEVNCNPPIEVTIGESAEELCTGGGTPITVSANSSNFCDATEFYLPVEYAEKYYYLYSGGYYIAIEEIGDTGVFIVTIPCTGCTTTTTSTTTTTTTILYYYYNVLPFDMEICETYGEPIVMRSTSPVTDLYVCIGSAYQVLSAASGPTFTAEFTGVSGNSPCTPPVDFFCS